MSLMQAEMQASHYKELYEHMKAERDKLSEDLTKLMN